MATIAIGVSPSPGKGYSADVPLSALEENGVPPEEGDKVSFSVDATVKSVSGGTASIEIDSINGEPVSQGAGAEEGSESEEEGEEQNESPPGAGGGPSGPKSGADGLGMPPVSPVAPVGGLGPAAARLGALRKRNALAGAALRRGAPAGRLGLL